MMVEDRTTRGQTRRMSGPDARSDTRASSSSSSMASGTRRGYSMSQLNACYANRATLEQILKIWGHMDNNKPLNSSSRVEAFEVLDIPPSIVHVRALL